MAVMTIDEVEPEYEPPMNRELTAEDLVSMGLPASRPLTVEDLKHTPDDGRKYELADGRLDVSPAPVSLHSLAEGRLLVHLANSAPSDFHFLPSPGVTLNDAKTSHRIPDVAVIHAAEFGYPYQTTPPVLAIEVLSPESVFRDTNRKRQEYAAFGIESYWIINPSLEKPGILALRLEDGQYREAAQVYGPDLFETDVPFPLRLVPEWLIADGDWKTNINGPVEAKEAEQEPEEVEEREEETPDAQ